MLTRSMIQRLFVYGTLAPGRANEHILADVPGQWEPASVSGRLLEQGWGAAVGYPGLVLDQQGSEVRGFLFSSEALAEQWARLDQFEGPGYYAFFFEDPDGNKLEICCRESPIVAQ